VPTADWRHAWLTAPDEDKVLLLNLDTGVIVATIEVPGEPHSLVLSPNEQWAYVVQRRLNQLTVIETASRMVHKTVPLGPRPDMIAIDPQGAVLYVTVRDEHSVYVISTADLTVAAKVRTDPDPHGIAYRQATPSPLVSRARDTEMGWESGAMARPGERSSGQPMRMGQDMMGQGSCCGMGMCATSPMTSGMPSPMDMTALMGHGPIDTKTRGQLLQLQGEMLKAMGDVMVKYGQTLRDAQ
jgi:YVTN family beta-propeller protein